MHLRLTTILALSTSILPLATAVETQNEAFGKCCRDNGVSEEKINEDHCCNYEHYHNIPGSFGPVSPGLKGSTPAKPFASLAIDQYRARECLDASGATKSNRRIAERGVFVPQPSRYGYAQPSYYPVGPPSHPPTKATGSPPTPNPNEMNEYVNIARCMFENGDPGSTMQCCSALQVGDYCAQICNVSSTSTVVKSAKWWGECGYALSRLAKCGYDNVPTGAGSTTETPKSEGITARTSMIHGIFALLALYVALA